MTGGASLTGSLRRSGADALGGAAAILVVGRIGLDGNGEEVEAEGLAAHGVDVAGVVHLFGGELQLVEAAALEQLLGVEPRGCDVGGLQGQGAGLHRAYIENVLFHGC